LYVAEFAQQEAKAAAAIELAWAEVKRFAEAEARRKHEEDEAARIRMEEACGCHCGRRGHDEEAAIRRQAEAEAIRRQVEAEAIRRQAEAEAIRRQAEAEAIRRQAEAEAIRRRMEAEIKCKQESDVKRKQEEAEAMCRRMEAEIKRLQAAEAERKHEEAEAKCKQEIESSSRKHETEIKRKQEEEARRKFESEVSSSTVSSSVSASANKDKVSFSAFAPPRLSPAQEFALNIWAYLKEDRAEMIVLASVGGNEEKGTKQAVLIARDSQVDIALVPHADFEYANDSDSIVWTGDITNAAFAITVRPAATAGSKMLRAQIVVDGKPLGQIMITLMVVAGVVNVESNVDSVEAKHVVSASASASSHSSSAASSVLSHDISTSAVGIANVPPPTVAAAAAVTMPPVDSALPSETLFFRSTYLCHASASSATPHSSSAASSSADLLHAVHWRVMATAAQPQLNVTMAAQCESPLASAAKKAGDRPLIAEEEVAAWAAFDSFVLMWSAEVLLVEIDENDTWWLV
jgi:hypothetical protein